jgi:uncharacterized protein YfdQ (DUF2303 family)
MSETEGNYPATIPPIIRDDTAFDPEHLRMVVLPNEGGQWTLTTVDLEQYAAHPRRQKGAIKVRDVDSLIAYVNRHKDTGTLGFADSNGHITIVLNHHHDDGEPGWRDHTVTLERVQHTAFKAWMAQNQQWMTQEKFAEFLDVRMGEIIEPPGAALLEIAEFFQSNTTIGFSSSKLITNGRVQLHYVEDVTAVGGKEGNVTVPVVFNLLMRPYRDSKPPPDGQPDREQFVVTAKLRYRLAQGKVSFMFMLGEELEEFMDGLYADVIAAIEAETDVTVLNGQQL